MANARGFSWSAFFIGAIATFVLAALAGAVVIFGGYYPVAASERDPIGVGALLTATSDHAVERRAKGLHAPNFTPADVQLGGVHFKGVCAECHGAPGVKPEDFATAMNPRPPDLSKATDDLSVEQVFWIVKNGIKMSAMPAFGKTEEEGDLWKIAAFVKQISKVTPSQYAALPNTNEEGKMEVKGGDKAGDKN